MPSAPATRASWPRLRPRLVAIWVLLIGGFLAGVFAAVAWALHAPDPPEPTAAQPRGIHIAEIAAADFLAGRDTRVPVSDEADVAFGRGDLTPDGFPGGDESGGGSADALADDPPEAPGGDRPNSGEDASGDDSPQDAGNPEGGAGGGPLADDEVRSGPLDVAHLAWQRMEVDAPPSGDAAGGEIERHVFLVILDGGATMELTVPVHVRGPDAALAAHPTLLPAPPTADDLAGATYRDFPDVVGNVPDPVADTIDDWAEALLADDRAALRAITGDPSTTGEYVGLQGFELEDGPEVITAVDDQIGLTVRVRVWVRDTRANQFVTSLDYDLAVNDVDGALPRIVAWGPAGTGFGLTDYANNTAVQRAAD